jgi:hypothetical protein
VQHGQFAAQHFHRPGMAAAAGDALKVRSMAARFGIVRRQEDLGLFQRTQAIVNTRIDLDDIERATQ